MNAANNRLNEGGEAEVKRFLALQTANSEDIALGFILMSRYEAIGDHESMLAVAEKLRSLGTVGGQTVQIFSLLERMTPEGMLYYANKSLKEAWEEIIKGKSRAWIEKHREEYQLTQEEADSMASMASSRVFCIVLFFFITLIVFIILPWNMQKMSLNKRSPVNMAFTGLLLSYPHRSLPLAPVSEAQHSA